MEHPDSHQSVVVPVRVGQAGVICLTVCRRPDGTRTGLAFTSLSKIQRVMGEEHLRVIMSLAALRAMLAEIGVDVVQLDPEALALTVAHLPTAS